MSGQTNSTVVDPSDDVEPARRSPFYVDVRTPAEFGEVHIPGSINVPLPDIAGRADEISRAAGGKSIVLVCRTGGRAAKAQDELRRCGIEGCEVLDGGVLAWEQGGRTVERGRAAISLERQVRIAAGSIVLLGTALGALVTPWLLVIPAFIGAGLVFSGVTDTCGMGMLLARMPWNRGAKSPTCTV